MRLVALLFSCLIAYGQANSLSPSERKAGWQLLFDGDSLTGWRWTSKTPAPTPSWAVVDHNLVTTPGKGMEVYLLTEQSFTDFELVFSWRAEAKANSGIKYRIQRMSEEKRIEPTGLEYQITDDIANPDSLSDLRRSCGALYDYVEPRRSKLAAPDVWRQSKIIAKGLHIEHWLDGEKVINVDLNTNAAKESFAKSDRSSKVILREQPQRKSPIALQIHDGVVAFRDLKIRPL